MITDYIKIRREEARLIILKALAEQTNETLSSSMLQPVLAMFAINEERAWIHQQLDWLANMEAITVIDAGSVKIASLTDHGRRHLDRQIAIEGVKRPSRPGA